MNGSQIYIKGGNEISLNRSENINMGVCKRVYERIEELNGPLFKWTMRPVSLYFRSRRTRAVVADNRDNTKEICCSLPTRACREGKSCVDTKVRIRQAWNTPCVLITTRENGQKQVRIRQAWNTPEHTKLSNGSVLRNQSETRTEVHEAHRNL